MSLIDMYDEEIIPSRKTSYEIALKFGINRSDDPQLHQDNYYNPFDNEYLGNWPWVWGIF